MVSVLEGGFMLVMIPERAGLCGAAYVRGSKFAKTQKQSKNVVSMGKRE